jgi:hypothetical protein
MSARRWKERPRSRFFLNPEMIALSPAAGYFGRVKTQL